MPRFNRPPKPPRRPKRKFKNDVDHAFERKIKKFFQHVNAVLSEIESSMETKIKVVSDSIWELELNDLVVIETDDGDITLKFDPSLDASYRKSVHKIAGDNNLNHFSIYGGIDEPPRQIIVTQTSLSKTMTGLKNYVNHTESADIPKPQENFTWKQRSTKFRFPPISKKLLEDFNSLKADGYETTLGDDIAFFSIICPNKFIVDNSKPIWVDTNIGLQQVVDEINQKSVEYFAVDLESHSIRSYNGFTCLMQVNVNSTVYLIDTIALWDDIPNMMHSVFSNPHKLKIFHGMNNDVLWLQRDFNIYVVNALDTKVAREWLDLEGCPRSYYGLVKYFCDIDISDLKKKIVLSDWRQRPLTGEQLMYAQYDVVWLPYIADQLCKLMREREMNTYRQLTCNNNDVSNADVVGNFSSFTIAEDSGTAVIIKQVVDHIQNSICMKCWSPKVSRINDFRHDNVFKSFSKSKNWTVGMSLIFQLLFMWRDSMASIWDESVHYVCPTKILCAIAEKNPTTIEELERCYFPLPPMFNPELSPREGGLCISVLEALITYNSKLIKRLSNNEPIFVTSNNDAIGYGSIDISSSIPTPVSIFELGLDKHTLNKYHVICWKWAVCYGLTLYATTSAAISIAKYKNTLKHENKEKANIELNDAPTKFENK